jgi:hypothetical protein
VVGPLEQQHLEPGRVDHDQDRLGDLRACHLLQPMSVGFRWRRASHEAC